MDQLIMLPYKGVTTDPSHWQICARDPCIMTHPHARQHSHCCPSQVPTIVEVTGLFSQEDSGSNKNSMVLKVSAI